MATFDIYIKGVEPSYWGQDREFSLEGAIKKIERYRQMHELEYATVKCRQTGEVWVKRFK